MVDIIVRPWKEYVAHIQALLQSPAEADAPQSVGQVWPRANKCYKVPAFRAPGSSTTCLP